MNNQTRIIFHGRGSSSTSDDMSTNGASVAVCGVGAYVAQEIEAGIDLRTGGGTQRIREVVHQTLEDGAEVNYRGEEARVGLYMSVKSADVVADAGSDDSSDMEELEKADGEQLNELMSLSQYFGLQGPRYVEPLFQPHVSTCRRDSPTDLR